MALITAFTATVTGSPMTRRLERFKTSAGRDWKGKTTSLSSAIGVLSQLAACLKNTKNWELRDQSLRSSKNGCFG